MKVDLNLLPVEHRPNKLALPLTVGLIVVILAAGYFGYGFYTKNADANSQLEGLQAQLDSINAETQQVISDSQIASYQEQIAQTQEEIARLEETEREYEKYNSEKIYWKPVLQKIRELAPTDVTILSFDQNDDELTIEGELSTTAGNVVLYEYARKLEASGIFSRTAFEISTETRTITEGDESKEVEVTVFTMLLKVEAGGTQ